MKNSKEALLNLHYPISQIITINSVIILKNLLITLLLLASLSVNTFAQITLEKLIRSQYPNKSLDTISVHEINRFLYQKGSLNYLQPLKQLLLKDTTSIKKHEKTSYKELLGQLFSFIGDIDNATYYFRLKAAQDGSALYGTFTDNLDRFKEHDFKPTLGQLALGNKILMFNEAHHVPLQRTFVASILPQLKSFGFKYLALEALNGEVESGQALASLGYYTRDPQMSNLITYAQSLGFKLLQYEPQYSPGYNRDSLQAENILKVFKTDPHAKIVVLAGYGHIQEGIKNPSFKTMATNLREISGIDPITFSLINLNQYNNSASGLQLYGDLIRKFNPKVPSLLSYNYGLDDFQEGYDYYVLFPEYREHLGRPGWLESNPGYKTVKLKPLADFQLIQAYKLDPVKSLIPSEQIDVPSDQCYLTKNQKGTILYLFPGEYEIVYRDIDYQIIKSFKIKVNTQSSKKKR